jgi:hypothetical protein
VVYTEWALKYVVIKTERQRVTHSLWALSKPSYYAKSYTRRERRKEEKAKMMLLNEIIRQQWYRRCSLSFRFYCAWPSGYVNGFYFYILPTSLQWFGLQSNRPKIVLRTDISVALTDKSVVTTDFVSCLTNQIFRWHKGFCSPVWDSMG